MPARTFVGSKVRRLRREHGLTQVEMAGRLGISPSYLNLIEHNQRGLTRPLLLKLGEILKVDLHALSDDAEARLMADLIEIFGEPMFAGKTLGRDELSELVGAAPGIARAILALYRAYRRAREDALGLSERLTENPFLEASSHRLLTLLTSIRSFSEILRDNADLAPERRQQFIATVAEESEKLTDLVNELFEFFGGDGRSPLRATDSPADEVVDFLHARNNHFPTLEAAATEARRHLARARALGGLYEALVGRLRRAHGIEVRTAPPGVADGPTDSFDAAANRLELAEFLPPASRVFAVARRFGLMSCAALIEERLAEADLSGPDARSMTRRVLGNYFAGALIMPYEEFLGAAQDLDHDIERLQQRFGVSFEQACHRLTTLQRPGAEGVPFHFLRVDAAGNITKRYSRSGLRIPHFGGTCPRWNIHSAFMTPGRVDTQIAALPDGATYIFVARADSKPGPGFGAPRTHYAVSVGCDISFADRLVYVHGRDMRAPGAAMPVGLHCRQCERQACRQRAFPALVH